MPDAPLVSVSADQILAAAGADKPVTAPTYLQRTGLLLATSVGALAGVVTLLLVSKWMYAAPAVPIIPVGSDPATVKLILENFKTLQQLALEPYTTLLDSIVVKVLLPVFTSILGYIFGSRSNGREG
jgi:hypothetical protein